MKTAIKAKIDLQDLGTPPKKGQTIEGSLIEVNRFAAYVDLGIVGTGIIYGREYSSAKEILKGLKPGEKLKAKIVIIDNEDGYSELSLQEAQEEINWENLKKMKKNSESIIIKISGANKGGLLTELEKIRGFLPLSQLSIKNYPRIKDGDSAEILKHLQELVGQKLEVKIIDISSDDNKLIFSEKAVTSQEINKLLGSYKAGDIVKGKVTGLADFGVFVKFPLDSSSLKEKTNLNDSEKTTSQREKMLQVEGLIHISEIGWQLIDNISEIVKVGDIVKVKITNVSEDGKVSLSLKALKEDPWKGIEKKYKEGSVIKGKVIKISQLGAFVEIAPDIRGLVHLTVLDRQAQNKKSLTIGKKYNFEIITLDEKAHKMGLRPQIDDPSKA